MVLQLFVLSIMGNLAAKYWTQHNTTLLVTLPVILTLCLNNHH